MKKFACLFTVLVLLMITFGTMFALVQQSERLRANDVPLQAAQAVADELNGGTLPSELIMSRVNMANSLSPFVIVYDKNGKALAGSGYLEGKLAIVPKGVLLAASKTAPNAVTWQPQTHVRIASVTVAAKGYYILGGQSLKTVENRANTELQIVILGWFLAMLVASASYLVMCKERIR